MIKFIVLAAVVLLASSAATSFDSVFAEVPETKFGKALSSLIQMHNTDGDLRLKEISDLLYDLQSMVDTNQKDSDTYIEKVRNECSANISDFETKVQNLKTNISDSKGEQTDLIDEESKKKQQLSEEKNNASSTSSDLDQAKTDLSDEETKFTEYKASFDEAIIACEEGIRLLQRMIHGNSFVQVKNQGLQFVQLSQKFTEVQDVLKSHVKKGGPAVFVQPIIDVLTEVSASNTLNYERVQQIIELIQTLLARLRQGLQERTQQNQKTTDDLNALISTLNTALNNSNTQIGILETRLSEIATRLGELTGVIANLDDLLVIQEKTLADTKANCEEEENNYTTETSKRTANLALLDKLIQHFETQVVTTTKNVRDGQLEG